MHTNQFFSFSRMGLLFRNDFLVNYKKIVLWIVVAFLIIFSVLTLNMRSQLGINRNFRLVDYMSIYCVLFIGFCTFYFVSSFPLLKNKNKSQTYLLLPTSTFEKYVYEFITRIILGTAVINLLFALSANLARLFFVPAFLNKNLSIAPFNFVKFMQEFKVYESLWMPILIFSAMAIALFVIRLYFRKNSKLSTIITLFILVILYLLILSACTHIFYHDISGLKTKLPDYKLENGHWIIEIFFYILFSILSIGALITGYFKLKEREL